jgi:hypothetical protein
MAFRCHRRAEARFAPESRDPYRADNFSIQRVTSKPIVAPEMIF